MKSEKISFEPIGPESEAWIRPFYAACSYRLCDYSMGVKLMLAEQQHARFAVIHQCLICQLDYEGQILFELPVPGPEVRIEDALRWIETWCAVHEVPLTWVSVPEESAGMLVSRYVHASCISRRLAQDYLYRTSDLMLYEGRHYAGQRNHVHQFYRKWPEARFVPLTASAEDTRRLSDFWTRYAALFHKEQPKAMQELEMARGLFAHIDRDWFVAGGMEMDGMLIGISLGEICGDTLVIHTEKALYTYPGVYPALVQAFATYYGKNCLWINREDDAADKGLRISKLQYRPVRLMRWMEVRVGCELESCRRIPELSSERLTMNELTDADASAYARLCLDEERNRRWGYDWRSDWNGPAGETPDGFYFLQVCRADFAACRAVNFAVRLGTGLIGEAVVYHFDGCGNAELGVRIASAYAGNGYGREACARVADWALYELGVTRLTAKCFHDNIPSDRMLSSCMTFIGSDATYRYYEKQL